MEEDIHHARSSKPIASVEKIRRKLLEAIDAAEERQSYEAAHDQELLRALGLVEAFIRRKKRVCYGGTAMNAILPPSKKFYNPEYDLPDYDFYTPALDDDVEELVNDLKTAGFREVHSRVGMHDGTKKILVNFVAVADVSRIEPELFAILYKRAIVRDGIHYTDPDVLRMMMYLELSRPKGQVERWEKVWERLQLINEIFPIRGAHNIKSESSIPMPIRHTLFEFMIEQKRVLCNGALAGLYSRGIHGRGHATFQIREGGPVLALSPSPKEDAVSLKKSFQAQGFKDVRVFSYKARGEIVPERVEIRVNQKPVALFMQEVACHSYHPFPLRDGRLMLVGSLETLITISLALTIFTTHWADFLGRDPMPFVKRYIQLTRENILVKKSQFPPFSLLCRGYQVGYASLIRRKVQRIQAEKEGQRLKTRKARRGGKKRETRKGEILAAL